MMSNRIKLLRQIVLKAGNAIADPLLLSVEKQKEGYQDIVTKGDLKSEEIIVKAIQQYFPEDEILSEETASQRDLRDTEKFLWVIDPIDGTVNYARRRNYSAVSVAIVQAREVVAGAVFNPFVNELYFATKGQGAYLNDQRIYCSQVTDPNSAIFVTDNGRSPEHTRQNLNLLLKVKDLQRLLNLGSAALSICEVAAGKVDLYLHSFIQPWDCAAAFVITLEAGAQITNFQGNNIDFYSSQVVIANPGLLSKFHHLVNENEHVLT